MWFFMFVLSDLCSCFFIVLTFGLLKTGKRYEEGMDKIPSTEPPVIQVNVAMEANEC